jgi:hypothetical protein
VNDQRYDLLAGTDEPRKLAQIETLLRDTWNVHSREDLTRVILDLALDNGSREAVAWNYPRAVIVARWGYAMGYLSEAEAWTVIMPAAQRLQQTFSSWHELGRSYLTARQVFWGGGVALQRENEAVYRSILMDPASPWRKYPWNLDLGGGPVKVTPAKSAELILAVHAHGLMCARVRVPDHLDAQDLSYEPYLTAIGKAVGCKPRVTAGSYTSKDWVLDTECTNEKVVDGDQVVAKLPIESIAEQLRHEGVTELFLYIQHDPKGASMLVPKAQDFYISGELQWYTSTLPLDRPLADLSLIYGSTPPGTLTAPQGTVRLLR